MLDLGSRAGSYDPSRYSATTVRLDIEPLEPHPPATCVQGDAARLPFRDGAFDAVICNHGLEHFERLKPALREIGRVLAPGGAVFATVPDAGTLTDRLYRFLASGGGHVNFFRSPDQVAALVSEQTALPLRGWRTLFTSLSFLHPANRGQRRNRRFLLLLGAGERALRVATWLFRQADRRLGTRLAIYGWAFYFGSVEDAGSGGPWTNVCIRCGAGHPSDFLAPSGQLKRPFGVRTYKCPRCGTENFLTDDRHFARAN